MLCWSLPVRGAWIEMGSPHLNWLVNFCRSPCGERGLKYRLMCYHFRRRKSLPVRGAWIEIYSLYALLMSSQVAPRAGSVD